MANRLNVANIGYDDNNDALTIASDGTISAGTLGSGVSIEGFAGMIASFATNSAPTGWLACDGSAISRTTYARLFTVISTTWGVGDGSTTFNLPDLRGEFLRGFDGGKGVDSGRTFASFQEGSHHMINTSTQILAINNGGQRGDVPVTSSVFVTYLNSTNTATLSSSDPRFGMARPRNIAVQYCIKF